MTAGSWDSADEAGKRMSGLAWKAAGLA